MQSLTNLSIHEMRTGLLERKFSAVELTQAHLEKISLENPIYNHFVEVSEDYAYRQSVAADKTIKDQAEDSPILTGIPFAAKDVLVTKDIPTTCGSKMLKNFISPYSSTAIDRLESRGAVLLGKTNLDEFAMGSSSEHSVFGPVKNPWDTTRVAGGTSGGSAVASLLGNSPFTLGTDTGGSVRQPAAFCGVLGLKPTYGLVSRYGLVAHASSFDQIGPISRNIDDLAIALEALAGHDPRDSTSVELDVPNYLKRLRQFDKSHLKKLRIGIPSEYFAMGIDSQIKKTINDSLEVLEELGVELVEISLPHTEYALAAYYIITSAEASSNLSRFDGIRYGFRSDASNLEQMYERTRSEGFGKEVKRRILIGTYVLSAGYYEAHYKKAQQVRSLVIQDFNNAFEKECDLIATPVSPTTAFKLGEKTLSPLEMYMADVCTVPINLAGLPAISIPCGKDTDGLPIGLQLIAPYFKEPNLLAVGNILLNSRPFDFSRPEDSAE